jgi:hypothetical protein
MTGGARPGRGGEGDRDAGGSGGGELWCEDDEDGENDANEEAHLAPFRAGLAKNYTAFSEGQTSARSSRR